MFDGSLTTIRAHERSADGEFNPTYRCLFPEPPPPGTVPTCAEAGVMGALAGMLGSMMALEAIREIVGFGDSLVGRLVMVDARADALRDAALWARSAKPAQWRYADDYGFERALAFRIPRFEPSLRGAKRRRNPSFPVCSRHGSLRFARNDVDMLFAISRRVAPEVCN